MLGLSTVPILLSLSLSLSLCLSLLWPDAKRFAHADIPDRDPSITVCKRVSALPGDVVDLSRGEPKDRVETAAVENKGKSEGEGKGCGPAEEQDRADLCLIVVPPGRVWLRGDNPRNSTDSRQYGAVPIALVEGRVVAKLWPPREMGRIRVLE